jgi:hypothetical protein
MPVERKPTRSNPENTSRRKFLKTVGVSLPTLTVFTRDAMGTTGEELKGPDEASPLRFVPIELSGYFNCSPIDYGPQERAKGTAALPYLRISGETGEDGLIRTPAGRQAFQGIPFSLGPDGTASKRWLVLSRPPRQGTAEVVEIPIGAQGNFVCLAAFCDWDEDEASASSDPQVVTEKVGQLLARAVFVFDDGQERSVPIRRRFEVTSPNPVPHLPFTAVSHVKDAPSAFTDPLPNSAAWGFNQESVAGNNYPTGPDGRIVPIVWVSALANPEPQRTIKSLRLEAAAEDALVICGLTLFHGQSHPLKYDRLTLYRITLPEPAAEDSKRWEVEVDLGVVARKFVLQDFSPEAWLSSSRKGLGESAPPIRGVNHLYVELTASPEAVLTLRDNKTEKRYLFGLGQVVSGKELVGRPGSACIEILRREKAWVHAQVLDAATQRPTPVRIAFRSKEGRYIPPYGHRNEVNDAWFEDYGADIKLMDTPFAYVDGNFQIELPVGEVFVEVTKGFEYQAMRQRVEVSSHQRELTLEIPRLMSLRSQGWATADVHVHFLPPTTAVLEGQAEGVNLINLLAAQWGDMFTNIGDFFQGPLISHDRETIVWVGTENRQHILGHLALLGGHGAPTFPLSASGPGESYLGDPLWTSMADWADDCRQRGGLVVCPHFPYPTGEVAADIALGKYDALEVYPMFAGHFNSLHFQDWYRYLNCGYRLPAVGGTDKMAALMPVGANRTYAHLGQDEFTFANWAKAVRGGNTFVSSGPLMLFKADGHVPGEEIIMRPGGGVIEVTCHAICFAPIHSVEVVLNGQVIASREAPPGAQEINLHEKIHVPGPGWIAARCISNLDPTTSWYFRIAAHTSPVYLRVPGQELFSASTVAYMLTLIEGAEAWADTLAIRPDPERFERVKKVFQDARKRLHEKLHQHGIQH